ncbi:AAEL003080-PA [Aedes aegypti]|uniref:AAEL003080-PA n=1 Tax=Aedes aegypti TaxID=7159 RepID=Q0IGA3_AEDAE|nr:AAEL003080-PA [Aedes aegypti]
MNERRSDSVLKAGYMVKRSQNKKRFTPVNYKTRWFELTRLYLSYYDIGNLELGHCMTLYPSDIHPHPLPLYCTSKATSNVSFVIQSTLI